MGRLSRSGDIYSYERTKDGGDPQVKRSDINFANSSYQRSQRSKEDRNVHLWMERKPRAPEFTQKMMSNKTLAGTTSEALAVLKKRLQQGILVDSYMFVDVLKSCGKQKDLSAAKQVHDFIIERRMDKAPYVATALLNLYIKSGELLQARRVFDELERKDAVTWNAMIGGYAKSEQGGGHDAYRLFLQMRQQGFEPNANTYLSILNASASEGALEWVKEVHGYACKAGLESDVRVGSALIHMYAECGSLDDARLVFDRMEERNVVTWTGMIGGLAQHGCGHEAYRLFLKMRQEGFEPNAVTYTSILNPSASEGSLEWVKEVQAHACKAGLELDERVGSALVHMYAEIGSLDDARLVFDRMEKRNVITWTAMIGGLAKRGCGHEAYRLFLQMRREGVEPNAITYVSILNASASAGALEWVKGVHGHARKAGMESDVRVGSSLIHMYAKSGSIDDARLVFDRMGKRDVMTWNIMIGGLAECGCGQEAYQLFLKMRREGFKPDAITYVNILNVSASAGSLEWVKEVHAHASKAGLDSDVRVGNVLVHMYSKSGSLDDARLVFDRMETRNLVTWNITIGGFAEHGRGHEALDLFRKMIAEGVNPDESTFMSMLSWRPS